jgi:hypothetical protein
MVMATQLLHYQYAKSLAAVVHAELQLNTAIDPSPSDNSIKDRLIADLF